MARVSITVQKGISGSDVRVRPAVTEKFHQRYCRQTLSESENETKQTGRGSNQAACSDLSPTSHVSAGALPGKALSVRQALHKKPSVIPFTWLISPHIKWSRFHRKRRRQSGVWWSPEPRELQTRWFHTWLKTTDEPQLLAEASEKV